MLNKSKRIFFLVKLVFLDLFQCSGHDYSDMSIRFSRENSKELSHNPRKTVNKRVGKDFSYAVHKRIPPRCKHTADLGRWDTSQGRCRLPFWSV